MIDSKTLLYIISFFSAYILFYTYFNDYNIFLLIILLMLGVFWCYLYINEIITKCNDKIENIEKIVGGKIDFLIHKLFNKI